MLTHRLTDMHVLTHPRTPCKVLVLGALEGFAYDAGVRPGDRILKIDGEEVTGVPLDEVRITRAYSHTCSCI